MYGVLITSNLGQMFKVYSTSDEAIMSAQHAVCGLGWKATIFTYNSENNTFFEEYEVV